MNLPPAVTGTRFSAPLNLTGSPGMSDLLPFRTHGEQLADRTAAEIDGFRQLILSDDLLLCEVVAGGKFTWMRE